MDSNQGSLLTRIAIVGVSCRFPGADTQEEFWQLLKEGRNSMQNLPSERWGNLFNSMSSEIDLSTQRGGFLTDIDLFDSSFFRINPKEAQLMDPQQRLLLELSWEAMEDAGYASDTLKGKSVGVYVGVCHYDYRSLLEKGLDTAEIAQIATGTAPATFANRLSYFYDFHGPSLTVDTACSSSLVALSEAVNAIRRGQCQTALVGGVNLICSPVNSQVYTAAGMLSPDGVCRVFDAGANGFVRGEGGAVVVLKDYQKALRDGDHIYGVVRSVAVNHGGQASSFTAPNPQAQAELLEEAYQEANIDIESVSYIEAHGTGTSLGDPIEVEALNEAFKRLSSSGKLPANSCGLGSVKTNIGHLEGAAGMAGLIKVLLCMRYATLPSSLNYQQLNPEIELKEGPFFVVDKLQSWEVKVDGAGKPYPLRAGLSSFGFGGTNAHVVLEEGINKKEERRGGQKPSVHLLTLSAKTETALGELVSRYQKYLNSNPESNLGDICYSANTGRVDFNHRVAAIASNKQELAEKLKEYQGGELTAGVLTGELPEGTRRVKVGFLFTGQGSQYVNMGQQLYQTQPVFCEVLDRCDAILSSEMEFSLLDVLYNKDSSLLNQTAYTQPALFAIEYALYKLWESWGIKPSIVMGHSVGEYVAATVAGVFNLEDGLRLIAARGRLMQQLPSGGEMVSVMASESTVSRLLEPYQEIAIAAINGPESTVISGESVAVTAVVSSLEAKGIKTKKLEVSHAFHSPLMEPMLAEFEAVANKLTYNQPQIPIISNVTGTKADGSIASPQYWVNHVRQPVRFAEGMKTLHEQGYEIFIEVGPKPVLLGMGKQCLPEDLGVWLPSLRPGVDEWQQMLLSLGNLYVKGAKIDWLGFNQDYTPQKVALPTYPFQRERHWIETKVNHKNVWRENFQKQDSHPLLGDKIKFAGKQKIFVFESYLGRKNPPYLSDHQVFDEVLFPTTAYLEMATAAGKNIFNNSQVKVTDLVIGKGLILPEAELKIVQIVLTSVENNSYKFEIFSTSEEGLDTSEWIFHAEGKLALDSSTESKTIDLEKYQKECSQAIEISAHYQKSQQLGIYYGSSFQGIKQLWKTDAQAIAEIALPQEIAAELTNYNIHPALLDAALQVTLDILPETTNGNQATYLPVGVEKFKIYGIVGASLWAHASIAKEENRSSVIGGEIWKANVILSNQAGEIIAKVEGLQFRKANAENLLGKRESITKWMYEVEWRAKGRLGQLPAPDYLHSPKEIERQLQPVVSELIAQKDLDSHGEISRHLEKLSFGYVLQAIKEIKGSFEIGDIFNGENEAQRLGIVPSQQRLFKRMLQMLADRGILKAISETDWQVIETLEGKQIDNSQEKGKQLEIQYPESAELTLLNRCASQLSSVLRGAIDPVQLVFPSGDLTTTSKMYQESTVAKVMNTIVEKAIATAIEKLPKAQGVRLLEIGAGTGSTAGYILPHLPPNNTEYVFTDIGALFTTKAQEKFGDYAFVDYRKLDIELNPTNQGFESHQYDVIVAANVIHATKSLKETLSHVKQLLAPGGMLVLLEVTTRQWWLDFVFGLLDGWWRFQDTELRPDYPLLSRSQWPQVLSENGFREVVILPEAEGRLEALLEQSVIIAQATPTESSVSQTPQQWLILADSQGRGQKLATQLESAGDVCTLVFAGDKYQKLPSGELTLNPDNPQEFEQLITEVAISMPALYGVVQCWTTEIVEGEKIEEVSRWGCGSTLSLVQGLVKVGLSTSPRLWLVTAGAQPAPSNHPVIPGFGQSSVWGMGKVISLEHPELNCVRIDLDPQTTIEEQVLTLCSEIKSLDKEDQVALRGDGRYVARLVASHHQQQKQLVVPSQPFKLEISEKGSLDSLSLEPTNRREPAAGEVEIRVRATGLNFRDVLIALNLYPGEPVMGVDCAGEIVAVGAGVKDFQKGDLVLAMAMGSFSQYVTIDTRYVALKPENLSLEEAASIPANFLTAHYGLQYLAKIRNGDRVLIHAAAGGTGMAAVQIAQAAGAEVFATASPAKWEVLRQMGVKHIMNSRTLEFADQIMSLTSGQGVDIVLNSLTSGEFINKSVDVLNDHGRFVELAVRDIWDEAKVKENKPDMEYFRVNLHTTSLEEPELINSMLQELSSMLATGKLKPPPLTLFPIEEVVSAFRYMQQAKHIGKIVVTQTEPSQDSTKISFRDDTSYLITGGMGGLGLLVASWMVSQGAKHIVLMGRRDPDETAQKKIKELETAGASVVVEIADVSDRESMEKVLSNINHSTFPLAGVIHSAGTLSDGVIQNQTWSSFEKVMAPKVQGAWYLHELTKQQSLDFFVLFSSVASLLGNPGQANHSAANAFMDGLAHYRRTMGLPGLSIHWGAVSQVGEAAERGADVRLNEQGMGIIPPAQVLESLELLMSGQPTMEANHGIEVGVVPIEWSKWQERVGKWRFLADWQETTLEVTESSKSDFVLKLEATAPSERRSLLVAHVRHQVALVLGINKPESIGLETGFFDLGMDSLTSVELRNKLQTSLKCSLPSTLAFDYPKIGVLVDYLAKDLLILEEKKENDSDTVNRNSNQNLQIDNIAQKLAEKLGVN
ncbi:MAG: SDR family NAD(P)-dependent oxidoreductase [Okeania sp. SIO2G4]|uniref:type I polyketide synthase n=1 Tax=unclassified Okeania TaxID=2634635 RepID=UPI0013BCF0FB|nr:MULTISPECIES: type I polyketide synthase [unclassified Okeania]NEP72539.1 SDR family NAD(P)-dependent oxidoreductase [Okeania sp. SIO2G5]NEP95495.1 SDR family NAD(P)-dependent oxidoreductase [Okeania sp. SIO2F5]NEQ91248.1 SDR family NAD(P)-dependent oxidoreductase [Okeania sp. SIO2G4]